MTNSLFFLMFLFSSVLFLSGCGEDTGQDEDLFEQPGNAEVGVTPEEEDFYLVVDGGDFNDRRLDLSISVGLGSMAYLDLSKMTQAKVVGGYAEDSNFGTAILTLIFPGNAEGEFEIDGRGDPMNKISGIDISSIEILGLPALYSTGGTVNITNYPQSKGDWLSGSFEGEFTPNVGDEIYDIRGEFAAEW